MSPRIPIHWLLLLATCAIITLILKPSTPPSAHIDWLFLIGALIVIAMFLIGLFVSIYKLIREYKRKGPFLMEKWRSILFYLVICPAFVPPHNKIKITSAQNAYEIGGVFFGGWIARIIVFYALSLVFSYGIAWLVKMLTKRKLSPNVFGIVILLLWLPANISMPLLAAKTIRTNKKNLD